MLLIMAFIIMPFILTAVRSPVLADDYAGRTGTVVVVSAHVRLDPAVSSDNILTTVYQGQRVTILQRVVGGETSEYGPEWYEIRFTKDSQEMTGFIVDDFVVLDPVATPASTEPTAVITDPDFEAILDGERFPDSYRPGLRQLHDQYPDWIFKAVHIDLDWETIISQENYPGRSLIHESFDDNWKSLDAEAYDWRTDTWVPYDSDEWIMGSKETIAYYLDPRNRLDDRRIFMFENLEYQPDVQTGEGVMAILAGTFMEGREVVFEDPDDGTERTMPYPEVFIEAARYANVSPYHLAARVRQEVGTDGSRSVTGEPFVDPVDGLTYEGYYNFYNIGASPPNSIERGLRYARVGSISEDFNGLIRIPWTDPFAAITGGAFWIGSNYIHVGQNTLYFQKFDVIDNTGDSKHLYWHQYMTNLAAPDAESAQIADAYAAYGIASAAKTFLIPVYRNMPEAAAPQPTSSGNPNNWLKQLTINGHSLTPTFDGAVTDGYMMIVDHQVTTASATATPVSEKATVASGKDVPLAVGYNPVDITVQAENGSERVYTVTVTRRDEDGGTPTEPPPVSTPAPTPAATPAPSVTPSPEITPTPTVAPTLPASPELDPVALSSTTYAISPDRRITGIAPECPVSVFIENLSVTQGYQMMVVDPSGAVLTGLVGSGTRVRVQNGSIVESEYRTVLFGDTNGDGKINVLDLTLMSRQVTRRLSLEDVFVVSADVNRDSLVNVLDLTLLSRHITKRSTISQ